jgi:hypothetical protein
MSHDNQSILRDLVRKLFPHASLYRATLSSFVIMERVNGALFMKFDEMFDE